MARLRFWPVVRFGLRPSAESGVWVRSMVMEVWGPEDPEGGGTVMKGLGSFDISSSLNSHMMF